MRRGLKQAALERAPNLATAIGVYRYLRGQQRRYDQAGQDPRPPAELVVQSPDGAILQLRDHQLGDLRLGLGELAASQKA